jgi:hypothetical protein
VTEPASARPPVQLGSCQLTAVAGDSDNRAAICSVEIPVPAARSTSASRLVSGVLPVSNAAATSSGSSTRSPRATRRMPSARVAAGASLTMKPPHMHLQRPQQVPGLAQPGQHQRAAAGQPAGLRGWSSPPSRDHHRCHRRLGSVGTELQPHPPVLARHHDRAVPRRAVVQQPRDRCSQRRSWRGVDGFRKVAAG